MGDKEIENRRVEEGVLFSQSDATATLKATIKARSTGWVSLEPASSVGLVPVGIEVKSSSESLYVQDVKVGKNSQSVCSGSFSSRLLDGRKLFRLDEIHPMAIALSVFFYNEGDTDVAVEVILHFELATAAERLFHPYPLNPPEGLQGANSFSARTQVGGYLVGLLMHPDLVSAVEARSIHFVVTAVDFDPHPGWAIARAESRRLGIPFEGGRFEPMVRPGTQRSVTLTSMADPGLLLFDQAMPIWVSERVTVEVVGLPTRQPLATDLLLVMDVDRGNRMNGIDSPRYDGNVLSRWR